MGIIRQKKKNIIVAATAGLLVGLVPVGIAVFNISGKYISVKKELEGIKESYKPYKAYVLENALSRGDIVGEDDLKEVTFYSAYEISDGDSAGLIGKTIRQETDKGIIITAPMVYEDEGINDSLRMYFFDYINIPEQTEKNTLFDIRISFPNGEDYIVATGKSIEDKTQDGVFINATEEELLMISSAYVDTTIYEGARLYASIYVADYQTLSVVNYPVNMYVTRLADWNPNLIEKVENERDVEKREILEENLFEFMGVSVGNAYISE